MSPGRYILGVILLVVAVGPIAVAATRVRHRWLQGMDGALGFLASIVIAIGVLVLVLEVAGSLGAFNTLGAVGACAFAGVVIAWIARRPADWTDESVPRVPPLSRPGMVVALLVVALVTAQWSTGTFATMRSGITEYDSTYYHLPFAARFVQLGSINALHYIDPEFGTQFHPANSELLHGFGMLLFGYDVVSPFFALAWMWVALLAAWCIGRSHGLGPAAVVAVSVVLASPLMGLQAGTARNDVMSSALLLASVAFLLHTPRTSAVLVLAAAAAGLAVGTKLTVIPILGAITVGLILVAQPGRRLHIAALWALPMLLTGGFWYIRNLVETGSPLANVHVGVGPLAFPSGHFRLVEDYGYSVASYLTDANVWRNVFLRGLTDDLGPAWWLTLALAVFGMILAITYGPKREHRVLGVAATVAVLTYTVTPTTAEGPRGVPFLFEDNFRYTVPALLLGLVMLPLIARLRWPTSHGWILALTVVALLIAQGDTSRSGWVSDSGKYAVVGGIAMLAVGLTAREVQRRNPPRRVLASMALVVGSLVIVLGAVVQNRYLANRYGSDPLGQWARDLHGQRIAIGGFDQQYALYGLDLTNYVQYLGHHEPHGEFDPIKSCAEWRISLRDGRYDFAILNSDSYAYIDHPEVSWTRAQPGVAEVLRVGDTSIFRIDHSVDPGTC